jgi:hypothetical protein
MSAPVNRRGLLAAIAAAGVVPTAAIVATSADPNPDAELIRTCAEHIENWTTYNREGGVLECDVDPLRHAYERTMLAIGRWGRSG